MRLRLGQRGGLRRVAATAGAVLVAGALAGAAGCSDDSSGTSVAEDTGSASSSAPASTAAPSNTAWNPCSIPEADLAAAGLNPERQVGDTSKYGTKFPGFDICGWMSDSWYAANVYSTNSHTFDEIVHNTVNYKNPRPVNVSGRDGAMLDTLYADQGCVIVFDAVSGPVEVEVSPSLAADTTGDSCAEAVRISEVLLHDFPKEK